MTNQKEITLTNGTVIRTLESNSEVSRGNRAKMIDWMDMSCFLSNEEINKIIGKCVFENKSDRSDIEGAIVYVSSSKHNINND